ncbi:putative membrane protein YdjX (TVP38/TMEM64 family) [Alkaliphilus hydrothermalis]|uniref:TVP38/TMEM64 family membrane protein n=2 Tax=Alkaliphilus hydrothermalis TaxID=1482730 RepID=A0ABS2NP72_9FIRM|nr:putative membrane protein YdjX (TVP38/TMEM64 family) [Alkaliphilus hydrothermalis]
MLVFVGIASIRPFILIPSALLLVLGGIIFGTIMGTILCIIGILISSSLCFFLASRFEGIFAKLLKGKYLNRLEKLKDKEVIRTLFMMRVTPGFPFDPISYGAGLTGISFYDFFIGTFLGSLPKVFLYSLLGDGIKDFFSYRTMAVFIILVLFALAPIFYQRYKLDHEGH